MKFLQLQLRAYGPFTDQQLDFAPQPGLHIIYGPNEAGKSSTLRAITDVLYGIPARTDDNFLHPYPKLRIGIGLQQSSGHVLQAVRRKAAKQALRADDDKTPLEESQLQSLLGEVDRDTFQMMFGIDHARLRRGGSEMVQGEGRVGELLFAASTGMTHLQGIQQQLTAQIEQLFKARSKNSLLPQQIERFITLRQELKAAQVSVDTWKQQANQQQRLEQEKEQLESQLREKKQQLNRWRRIHESHADIIRWQQAQTEWQSLQQLPDLPETFAEQVQSTLNSLKEQQHLHQLAESQLQKTLPLREELHIDEQILAEQTIIEALRDELGSVLKAAQDRPALVAAQHQAEAEALEILRQLGRPADLSTVETLRITSEKATSIQDLGNRREGVVVRRETLQQECDKKRREIQRLKAKLEPLESLKNNTSLRETLRNIQQRGNLQEQREQITTQLTQLQSESQVLLSQLPLWQGTLSELEHLPLPGTETLDRFEQQFREVQTLLDTHHERLQDVMKQQKKLQHGLAKLEGEQPILMEHDLQQIRLWREQGWELVRQSWQGPAPSAQQLEQYLQQLSASDLAEAFTWNLQEADRVVDALRSDSTRVVAKAHFQQDMAEQQQRAEILQQELNTAQEKQAEIQQEWTSLWSDLNIIPLTPREMHGWHRQQQELISIARELRAQTQKLQLLDEQIALACQRLQQELGQKEPSEHSVHALTVLLQQAAQTVEDQQASQTLYKQLQQNLEAAEEALEEAESRLQKAESELENWQVDWKTHMLDIGLPDTASPAQANRVLQNLSELFQNLAQAQDKQRRIAGIDLDAQNFHLKIRNLLTRIEQSADNTSPENAVQTLWTQLQKMKTNQEKQVRYTETIHEFEQQQQLAEQQQVLLQRQLQEFCHQAGCPEASQLLELASKSRRKQILQQELQEREAQILLRSAGRSLSEFIDDVLAESARIDLLPVLMTELEQEISRLEQQRDQLIAELSTARLELARIDGSGLAAEKANQSESLAAGLEEEVQRLAMLRLAAAVLQAGIEKHREKNQGPVLGRASSYFSQMTCGLFRGLEVDFDERGQMVLMGIRAENAGSVTVTGMSDGTCDQLFLALRLASLEAWLAEHEPLPFIVDDILLNFDDARAIAALQVLEQFSQKTQVLFFTHHAHLLELIRQHLPAENVQVHHLQQTI